MPDEASAPGNTALPDEAAGADYTDMADAGHRRRYRRMRRTGRPNGTATPDETVRPDVYRGRLGPESAEGTSVQAYDSDTGAAAATSATATTPGGLRPPGEDPGTRRGQGPRIAWLAPWSQVAWGLTRRQTARVAEHPPPPEQPSGPWRRGRSSCPHCIRSGRVPPGDFVSVCCSRADCPNFERVCRREVHRRLQPEPEPAEAAVPGAARHDL